MRAEALIDTNVFLYHVDDSDARKHGIAPASFGVRWKPAKVPSAVRSSKNS